MDGGFDMAPLASALSAGAAVSGQIPEDTMHAWRIYVGGLPPTASEQSVAMFFTHAMLAIGGNTAGPGDAVVNVEINNEKKFAYVEMRSVEEASNMMVLDGIFFEGVFLKVRRPSDYDPSLAATLGPSEPCPDLNLANVGLTPRSAGGLEGPDLIFVDGIPYVFTEAQIKELLESFGTLRGFELVKDKDTGNSKGCAFCVYQDAAVTDIACVALTGINMGDETLIVRLADEDANQPKPDIHSALLHGQQQIALQRALLLQRHPASVATKVVCLAQVVTKGELKDGLEYKDIVEDMKQERFTCECHLSWSRKGYADVDDSTKAFTGMNRRKFGGRLVIALFYPEDKFAQGDYDARC